MLAPDQTPPSAPGRARRYSVLGAAVAAVLVLGLSACTAPPSGGDGGATVPSALAQQLDEEAGGSGTADIAANALAVLATLDVAKKTEWDGPFDRIGSFGDGWGDPDGNGCDARNDALGRDLVDVTRLGDGCRVDTGTFTDPYSGETVEFRRGADTSDDVQIDHVVALYNAWRTGAQDLTPEERVALANDPLNLQPTVDWVNDEKMSQDASQWLPPDEAYHCTYVARQVAVKASYDLWVTPGEHDAMADVLEGCAA